CNLNNQPELWDQIAEATANEIIDIVSKVPENVEAPRVLTLLISSDTLKAYTHDSQPGVMINELGGINVVDEDGTSTASSLDISLEDIYALDPDIIFYSERSAAGVDVLMDLVGDSPVWQSLRAVQDGHMYVLEKGLFFNKANKRYNESYRTMASYLYPDFDFGGTVNTAAKLTLTEENGLLTCFDAETSPFEDCAVRVTVDQSAKTVTFTKATADGKDTQEYYCFMPEEHMMEQFYYVSMMGTGFYYYYDTELGEMVRMENMNHEDTTASAKENGRFDGPAERIKGEAAALESYFEESFGMTIAEAVQ
ncbi:MAG: ABC transporter substrate-binding protein, partial [Oscillospiraceae bacterium]